MNWLPRRFHLQLTPLLDLLLIVIFAQYLDVQQQAQRQAEATSRQLAVGQRELQQERILRDAQYETARRELTEARQKLADQEVELQQREADIEQRVQDVVSQQSRAAEMIGELFDVPADLIEQALKPLPADAPPRSAAETQLLRERFAELADKRGAEVIEHLLSYEELRKRADIWSLRIHAQGTITFTAVGKSQVFRASNADEFAAELFSRYKTLPQPKGLVVILVSYGDARADVRSAIFDGLPQAIRLMREDRLGTTQFEYAILGFVPETPVE